MRYPRFLVEHCVFWDAESGSAEGRDGKRALKFSECYRRGSPRGTRTRLKTNQRPVFTVMSWSMMILALALSLDV
jgi:hypothetical protein